MDLAFQQGVAQLAHLGAFAGHFHRELRGELCGRRADGANRCRSSGLTGFSALGGVRRERRIAMATGDHKQPGHHG